MLERLPAVVYALARDGTPLYTSPQTETVLGYSQDDELETPEVWFLRMHPDDRDQVRALWTRTIDTGEPFEVEYRTLYPDGEYRWVIEQAHVVNDGDSEYIQGVIMNIDARKRAEDALASSETRFRAIFENSGIGAGLVDRDGKIVATNKVYRDMLGYTAAELSGMTYLDLTHPDDAIKNLEESRRGFSGESEGFQMEKRYLRRDGEEVFTKLTVSFIHDQGGESILSLGMVEDITETRRLADQLRRSHKMEAIGRLAAGISHDFNTVLALIDGYSRILEKKLPSEEEELHGYLHEIVSATERGGSLIRQLLEFSRDPEVAAQVSDLGVLIKGVATLLIRTLGERVEMKLDLGDELWPARIDPTKFEQVIMNLAINARDAIADGGTFALSAENVLADDVRRWYPDLSEGGRYVRITAQDDGAGMPKEVLDHLFEPFFSTKPRSEGTGLGLSIVYGIIDQADGCIYVESAPGEGAKFEIFLPSADE